MTGSLQIKKGFYYAVLNFKDANGKAKQKWISTKLETKGNKRKAEQILSELKAEYDNTEYIEPNKILLCDFIKQWIALNKANIQVTTYDGYIHILDKHIYPFFKQSGILLNKVKPLDIQRYYALKVEEGLSPNTVIKHHAIIRSALQYAVKTNLVKENVADKVDKPKKQKFTGSFYGKDELNKLFSVAKGYPTEVTIVLAAYYGLRRSEVLGLKWSNIDFENRIISVCHKVVRGKDSEGKLVSMAQDKMKSESSHRSLPLCDFVYDYLLELKERISTNKQALGSDYNAKYLDYICVNDKGGLIQPDYVSDMFSKLLDRNGLRHIRYHDLRHSCATLLLALGYNLKDIQEWLGHSDFNITANTYTHVDYKNKINMINSVEGIFEAI